MNPNNYIIIDGSEGEGGGQILRTSITLSAILQKPVEIINIRSKRNNPGLRPQHVASIKAASSICNAEVDNLAIGSHSIRFKPGRVQSKSLKINVGTAGSITLILQLLIPMASLGGADFDLEITGGTDVRWSPVIDYFKHVVLPSYRIVGIEANIETLRRGYFPRGEGLVKVSIKRSNGVSSINNLTPRKCNVKGISVCSNLPMHVAERQMESAREYLVSKRIPLDESEIYLEKSISPGSSILIFSVGSGGPFLGGDAIGEIGKSAEKVGLQAAKKFTEEYLSGALFDRHVADMIIAPLSVAKEKSSFLVSKLTNHLNTNLRIVSLFNYVNYDIINNVDGSRKIEINPTK
uniref:RNA 3'-terminal phosphate cyclase n=1 Tax=uncultured marine thaumarchaeote KM3_06_C02 TaxID=1455976 RepID=A0A075G9S2_9ARCH|nr:RNA 3'-terminal-phosphate cyclase (rtcA, RTCD1) [uncultured marine thaumarchaeote KM3_06_C02]